MERAIEIALANPIDFEYAIDKEVSKDFFGTTEFYHVYVFTFDTFQCLGPHIPWQKNLVQPLG